MYECTRLLRLLAVFLGHDSRLLVSLVVPVWITFVRQPPFATVRVPPRPQASAPPP
jgi:hypothetical protein